MTISKRLRLGETIKAPSNTADVLSRPSQIDIEIAQKAVEQVDLDVVCRDLGAVVAREYADALERYALRPSDYSSMDEAHKALAAKLADHLKSSEAFVRAFQEQLKMRG